jgi:hypothetical protein
MIFVQAAVLKAPRCWKAQHTSRGWNWSGADAMQGDFEATMNKAYSIFDVLLADMNIRKTNSEWIQNTDSERGVQSMQ